MEPLRLKATPTDGGFALRLTGEGDLGEELFHAGSVVVEMEDGRTLFLYEALVTLIQSRVTGLIVLTDPSVGRQGTGEWLH